MRSLQDDVLHEYTYDAVNRLTRWQRGSDRFEEYTYDAVGNREPLTDEQALTTYSYDLANRLTQTVRQLTATGATTTTDITWDPNGNLLSEQVQGGSLTTYTWDALNRLTALDGPTGNHSYGYDPNGIRVRETSDGETIRFLHAEEDILVTLQNGALDTYFTHGPGIDEPWAQARTEDPAPLAYLHRDGLGSVTATSSSQAQLKDTATYGAFGSVESTSGLQTRYGYTSRELDPSGLLYYRSRYYQPTVGRFFSRDSVRGRRLEPSTLHGYSYVWNNPITHIDPFGTTPEDCPSGVWWTNGLTWLSFFVYYAGIEIGWNVYQCVGTGTAYRGTTIAFLVGLGLDFGGSVNTGVAFGAQTKYELEGWFSGFDVNLVPGIGIGFGAWASDTAVAVYASLGYGFGTHVGGGLSWTFDLAPALALPIIP